MKPPWSVTEETGHKCFWGLRAAKGGAECKQTLLDRRDLGPHNSESRHGQSIRARPCDVKQPHELPVTRTNTVHEGGYGPPLTVNMDNQGQLPPTL